MTDVQHFKGKQRERRSFTLNTRQSTLLMKTLAAISLLFGIFVSTVLTLVVIPVLYYAANWKKVQQRVERPAPNVDRGAADLATDPR